MLQQQLNTFGINTFWAFDMNKFDAMTPSHSSSIKLMKDLKKILVPKYLSNKLRKCFSLCTFCKTFFTDFNNCSLQNSHEQNKNGRYFKI